MLKICVYAIAKNEIKFIDRWYNSVKEADYICVLDTGSSDGSYEKFKSLGIITNQKIYSQFRFDVARNDSMKLIPEDTDICVCVDIDEVFKAGWANTLRKFWTENTHRASYRYTWNFESDGSEGIVFFADKIHKKDEFIWKHPVHEVLYPINKNLKYNTLIIPSIQLNHLADVTKSRSNYLPLLELSVKEQPKNDRNMHYLGREYFFHGEYKKSIITLKKYLNLKSATWKPERSSSLRYIALCYGYMKKDFYKEKYLIKSILECNYIREPYFELAKMYYEQKKYLKSLFIFQEMLKIQNRELSYISLPECWGYLPYDYMSMCCYYLKDYAKAIYYVKIAISLSPNNQRLINNLDCFNIKNS